MRILKLDIENFLTLTEASIGLDNRGLILVQGINSEDSSAQSNGAGKSSIADALCWALYGVTAREETGDAVVNEKAGKNTRVCVTINDDGALYTITRHRKHKVHKNTLQVTMDAGVGVQDLTLGTDKLTQEVVDRIIGCSLEVFTGSVYAGQEKMPDLPNMTDKFLKMLIEEAAGITALEAAYTLARTKMQVAKIAVDATRGVMVQNEAQAGMLESQKAIAEQDSQAWEENRRELIKTLQTSIDTDLKPQWEGLERLVDAADLPGIQKAIADIDAKLGAVQQEQVTLTQLNVAATQAQSALSRAEADAKRAITDFQRADTAVKDVQHQVGCDCQACGRPITPAEIAKAEQKAIETRDASRAAVVAVRATLEDAQRLAQEAAQAVEDFRATLTDVSAETARRRELESQQSDAVALVRERDEKHRAIDNVLATLERTRAEVSPYTARIADLDAKITAARALVTKTEGELTVKLAHLDLETEVVRVFSPGGVRARILDDVTPYLNDQTSKYLSIMSDGNINAEWSTLTTNKSGEVKEKFAINVASSISSKTFKGLSGGEKRKVRVATALALQDLVATRASKPIDLFVGDEIDDALDPAGLERLMIILREKAKERGTVLVISHNSLKDEIPAVITVERTATGQTVITETVG